MALTQIVRVTAIAVAMVTAVVIALATVVLAVDVFLLVFLGILFAVFLAKSSTLLASATPLSYGWNLGGVVTLLVAVVIGAFIFFGVRIETQLDRAGGKIEEAAHSLRERVKHRPQLREIVRSVPIVGELLNGDPASSSDNASTPKPTEDKKSSSGMTAPLSSLAQGTYAVAGQAAGVLGRVFATTFGLLANVGVVVFVGIFLAADPGLYTRGLIRLFPSHRRERIAQVMDELGGTLWRWLLGRFVSMLITGTGTGLALWLLGVPLAFTVGVVTALLTFIPNIGGVLALGLAVLLALPSGMTTVAWVVALYVAIQLIESNVITPLVQQRQVAVPPALLISFQLLMAALTGFLGVMVATPMLAAGIVCVQRLYVEDTLGDEVPDDS